MGVLSTGMLPEALPDRPKESIAVTETARLPTSYRSVLMEKGMVLPTAATAGPIGEESTESTPDKAVPLVVTVAVRAKTPLTQRGMDDKPICGRPSLANETGGADPYIPLGVLY